MSFIERADLKAKVLLEGQSMIDTMVADGEPMDITMYATKVFVAGEFGEISIDAISTTDRLYKYINKKYKEKKSNG